MQQERILKNFTKYVSLNILGQMAYSCYTLADTFFVSADMGANGLTALNLAFPVFCLINGIGLMIGMGGGTKYSIMKSRGESRRANCTFTNAVYMAGMFSAIFFASGIFFSDYLTKLLGADENVFEMTNTYLLVMLLFAPAFIFNHTMQCFVRNDGKPSLAMAAMMTGSFSNIILDYIFIFPLGMGIFGAIFATGLAPIISMTILAPYVLGKKCGFRFALSLPGWENISGVIASGIPPLVTEVTSGVVMLLFNFIILSLTGNVGVAAFSVITVISLVVVAIYTGLSQGIQPIISANHGNGSADNINKILKYVFITAVALAVVLYAVVFFGADGIVAVFNQEGNAELQELAKTGMRTYFLACPFIGFNIVLATYFISTERPRPAQLISLARGFIVLIPMALFLSILFKMAGVWCAYPITELSVAIIASIIFCGCRCGTASG